MTDNFETIRNDEKDEMFFEFENEIIEEKDSV